MTLAELCHEAARRGLRLEPRGENLAVIPARLCPRDFADELRQHKPALLAMLQAKAANLPSDCAPWLHIARQVLDGEFDGADKATVESLTIGLRNIPHASCREALARLPANKQKSER